MMEISKNYRGQDFDTADASYNQMAVDTIAGEPAADPYDEDDDILNPKDTQKDEPSQEPEASKQPQTASDTTTATVQNIVQNTESPTDPGKSIKIKKLKNGKTKAVKGVSVTSSKKAKVTLKHLKAGKKYYVKVCAISIDKKSTGDWSAVKILR